MALDFEQSQSRAHQHTSAIGLEYQKLSLKLDKIHAMFQYMEAKAASQNDLAQVGLDIVSKREDSGSRGQSLGGTESTGRGGKGGSC